MGYNCSCGKPAEYIFRPVIDMRILIAAADSVGHRAAVDLRTSETDIGLADDDHEFYACGGCSDIVAKEVAQWFGHRGYKEIEIEHVSNSLVKAEKKPPQAKAL